MLRDSNINLAWLSAFDAAARHLNFTKAADELGLTQGAISIQIRKLEEALNADLFERRGRHVVLTDEGHAYFPHVNEALESLSTTTTRMFSRQSRNVVSIRCYSPTFADHWIAPRLPTLMSDIPDLEVNLIIDYQASTRQAERDDIVISYEAAKSSTFIPLARETLIAACTPAYRDAVGEDWGQGVLIESAGPRVTWPAWRASTRYTGALDGRVIQTNSMGSTIQLAKMGIGVGLVALPFANAALAAGELVEIVPKKRLIGKTHGLSTVRLEKSRPLNKRVARWLLRDSGIDVPSYLT